MFFGVSFVQANENFRDERGRTPLMRYVIASENKIASLKEKKLYLEVQHAIKETVDYLKYHEKTFF